MSHYAMLSATLGSWLHSLFLHGDVTSYILNIYPPMTHHFNLRLPYGRHTHVASLPTYVSIINHSSKITHTQNSSWHT